MAKKNNSVQPEDESPKEKPQLEDIISEGKELEAEEAKRVEEAAKQAEEEKASEIEVDLDEEKEKTKKETREEIEKEVIEPLKREVEDLKAKQTPEEKDEYDKFVEDYTKEHGEAPEWKQVAVFLKDQAKRELKEEQEAIAREQKQQEEDQKKTEEESRQRSFDTWQTQLADMEKSGLIPEMKEAKEGDPGFDARIQLYGQLQASWNTPNPITNMYEVHARFYKPVNKQPAGADAPTDLGKQSGTPSNDEKLDYAETHRASQDLESYLFEMSKNPQK